MSVLESQSLDTIADHQIETSNEPKQLGIAEKSLIASVLESVEAKFAPVWPLADYVAVNPYAGFADQPFLSVRSRLRALSDLKTLMPVDFYRKQFAQGAFDREDIDAAIDELVADGVAGGENIDVNQVVSLLEESPDPVENSSERSLKTLAEAFDYYSGTDWCRLIKEEISKHCANHYDRGQAIWQNPWSDLSLFNAWKMAQKHDLASTILGLGNLRRIVAKLPDNENEAIAVLLKQLEVPSDVWEPLAMCAALKTPGWSAWAKYQSVMAGRQGEANHDFAGLLAIRLAYEVALVQKHGFKIDWGSMFQSPNPHPANDALSRFALLTACEIAYRKQLVSDLIASSSATTETPAATERKLAQMVFCIDVRSERIRRHLESASDGIETFGFAGFFGLPIEFVPLDLEEGSPQVPALISPQFKVKEEISGAEEAKTAQAKNRLTKGRFLRKSWKEFQASAASCFGFVEATGLYYGAKLFQKTVGGAKTASDSADYLGKSDQERLGPTLRGLSQQGMTMSKQVDAAESILRGIGITDNFARLVVFCGHGSCTENNPLQAGLDCGACGGHSGKANARLAAKLLNQVSVRQMLAERGIEIPDDTHFVAALHNTTTDELQFFDRHELPDSHLDQLDELAGYGDQATLQTRNERLPHLHGQGDQDLIRRSRDWSEIRPEWGLAGNAAFIVAPRHLTRNMSLDGRAFLHSYDYRNDPEFSVLEQIMTAPLVVAQWINMQYYASTVDQKHFGSGNKAVHNVVGRMGIFSGNGGDLMTGLPWQSVHDGNDYYHKPLRLQAVIAAPRAAVDAILAMHGNVADLLRNGWLKLIVIEDDVCYRYTEQQSWDELANSQVPAEC